jgi:hypothetical protein
MKQYTEQQDAGSADGEDLGRVRQELLQVTIWSGTRKGHKRGIIFGSGMEEHTNINCNIYQLSRLDKLQISQKKLYRLLKPVNEEVPLKLGNMSLPPVSGMANWTITEVGKVAVTEMMDHIFLSCFPIMHVYE